jgi:hypothetical protein
MRIRSAAKVLLGAMLSACATASPAPAAPPANSGHAALWQPYDILVHLTRLPRAYSCDELWYKFRGVLISLGAGRIDEVTPSDCASLSPDVHLRFVLPRLVQGQAAANADIQAVQHTIELAPGNPQHLAASDCHLVREMRQSLLTDLPLKVVSARFSCRSDTNVVPARASSAAAAASERYAVQIRALMPLWPARTAAAR